MASLAVLPGMSNDSLIFAGGAGFKGSRENYQNGKNYAHEGLKKSYSADIHLWHNGKWDKSGELSQGRAYGVSLPWNNSLLIIGGETAWQSGDGFSFDFCEG